MLNQVSVFKSSSSFRIDYRAIQVFVFLFDLMLNRIYWCSCSGVFRYLLLMSIDMNFASGVLTTLLNTIFAVSKSIVSVLVSPWYSSRSPLAVIQVRFTSSFSGRLSTTILAYMAVLFFVTCCFLIQNSVFVPFIRWLPSISFLLPWNSQENPFAPDFSQSSWNFGCSIRCLYLSRLPVSSLITVLAKCLYSCLLCSWMLCH